MPYWPLGLWFFAVALSMGWVMGPATDSVMGAVPEEKSGVASAMNDVTRQVAGALGTAVIGSLIASLYGSRISDDVAALPEQARVAAEDSIGQANAIAAQLPAEQGASLADAAADAFTHALSIGFTVAGAAALIAAIVVKRWLPEPPRRQRGDRDRPGARAAAGLGPDAQLEAADVSASAARAPADPQRRAGPAVAVDHVLRVRGVGLPARA